MPSESATEFVYIIGSHDDSRVKIGRSRDPRARLVRLQTAAPFQLCVLWTREGDVDLEMALHKAFRSRQTYGEWFDFGEDDAISMVADAADRIDPTLDGVRAKRQQAHDARLAERVADLTRIMDYSNTMRLSDLIE